MYHCRRKNCWKPFSRANNRCRHEKDCKKGELVIVEKEDLVCKNEWCMKKFKKGSNLKRHEKICRKKVKKTYACDICSKKFTKRSVLKVHLKTHEEKQIFMCDHCDSTYVRKDKYLIHLKQCEKLLEEENPVSLAEIYPEVGQAEFSTVSEGRTDNVNLMDLAAAYGFSDSLSNSSDCNEKVSSSDVNQPIDLVDFVSDTDMNLEKCISDALDYPDVFIIKENEYVNNDEPIENDQHLSQDIDYQLNIADATIKVLKELKHRGRRSSVKRQEFCRYFILTFTPYFNDAEFMDKIAVDLGFYDRKELIDFVNEDHSLIESRGRPMTDIGIRTKLYMHWLENSVISNDRRNARHIVKIKPKKIDVATTGIVDPNVKELITKKGPVLKAQKYIYSKSLRSMFDSFKKANPDISVSMALYYRCKPFYVCVPSEREMEGCLCIKCLNPHALFTSLKTGVKDLPHSLSEYLCEGFECTKDENINFAKIDCINGKCKNECEINMVEVNKQKRVAYYQFEPLWEKYFNKQGEEKEYKRSAARKDYNNVLLSEVNVKLNDVARKYLLHRYYVLVDKVYWSKFLVDTKDYVIWLDYSMNIKLTEKKQAQSAHFSGKQQTLHDTLIRIPENEKHIYLYHTSDDTNHDSVMTSTIIEDIIREHPEVLQSGRLILRSDNCSTQYKSRFVFKQLLNLADKRKVEIVWVYGEAGHGRGLIDAMAWFGFKGPLRHQIIVHDHWYKDANEMMMFLKNHFAGDNTKEYYYIDEMSTAKTRLIEREARPIPGCMKMHVISFLPEGKVKSFETVREYMADTPSTNDSEDSSDCETMEEEEWEGVIEDTGIFSLIKEDSYIAVKSPPGAELFHIYKVLRKQIADEKFMDSSKEHSILKGEPFIVGKWISFSKETKKYAIYKESKAVDAIIHVGEIFSIDVDFDKDLRMDILDYRLLTCNCIN